VSCQPVPGSPFDNPASVTAFALAAQAGGAAGLRIEGARNIAAVCAACALPLIGIIKRDLPDSPVRITPWLQDVAAIAAAGADIIAVDATDRPRPVPLVQLIAAIHDAGRLAMADASSFSDGERAAALGADLIGSTLSGYIGPEPPPDEPDLALVRAFVAAGLTTIAEGNYRTPAQAGAAIAAGALAVTVGSAITRPEHVTAWFAAATRRPPEPAGRAST
jgi:N-acetylmannosamine-6-phosphate 2-epimerase/N-acetylmannosamine kinase